MLTTAYCHGSGGYMAIFVEHDRQSIRLPTHDYSRAGAYFVTMCAFERECLFGKIRDSNMILNECGRIVADEWMRSPTIRTEIALDEWVIMPDHFHGIVWIRDPVGAHGMRPYQQNRTDAQETGYPNIQQMGRHNQQKNQYIDNVGIIDGGTDNATVTIRGANVSDNRGACHAPLRREPRSLSSFVAGFKSAVTKQINGMQKYPRRIWQRNYYERIIRSDSELFATRQYIRDNPKKWENGY